jgi:hypothetical protein
MERKLCSSDGTADWSPAAAAATKPFAQAPKSDDMASSMPSMLFLSKPPTYPSSGESKYLRYMTTSTSVARITN